MNEKHERQPQGEPVRVLVVDDEAAIRRNFKIALEDLGYQVSVVEKGERGIELLRQERFDVVLTDLRMAQLGGLKFISMMQQFTPDTPVIVVSGSGGVEDAVEALRLGAWDYLTKPIYDAMELHDAIRRVLDRGRVLNESRRREERLEEQVQERTSQLREAKQFADQIIANACQGIIVYDTQFRCLVWNPAMESISGVPAAQVVGQRPLDLFPHMRKQGVDRYLEKALAGEASSSFDVPYHIPQSGKSGWTSSTYGPHRDAEGKIIGVIAVVRDTTERKRTEDDLQESEERFRNTFEQAAVGIAHVAMDGRLIRINQRFCDIVGFSRAELAAKTFQQITYPPDLQADLDNLRRLLNREVQNYSMEKRYVRKDGSLVWVYLTTTVVRSASGEPLYLIGVVEDITQRKQAEDELRKSEETFSKIFKTSPAVIFIWSISKASYVDANEAFERVTGFSRKEVLGHGAADIIPWEDSADFEKMIATLQAQGRLVNIEQRLRNKSGEVIHCLVSGELIDLVGESCALVVASDISELRNLEYQLLRMQREESIGRLVNGVAHDLNNILFPILTSSELLKVSKDESKREKYLDIIQGSAIRAADLVRQLLLYCRGAGSARADVDLVTVIQDIVRVLRETFPKSIEIHPILPAHLNPVSCDETQIHQVVMNLCVNARDAMPGGGVLEIEAQNMELDQSFVAANPQARTGEYVLIRVSDSGSGISPEVLPKIFDPFFTTKPVGSGTGLGLSTVLGIVKSHEGFVDVQSRIGAGSQFLIYLPAKKPTAATPEPLREEEEIDGSGRLILVVEDEDVTRVLMQEVLESSGYRVICARNGADALEIYAARKAEVELVIMDMWMPVMGGAAAISQLLDMNPEVRVIAISGVPGSDDRPGQPSPAIKAFLQKPIRTLELMKVIREVIKKRH